MEVDEIDNDDDGEITRKKIDNEKDELRRMSFTEMRARKMKTRKNQTYRKLMAAKRKRMLQKKKEKKTKNNKNGKKPNNQQKKKKPSKVKEIEKLMYNQRKKKPNDKTRIKNFRAGQINKIMSSHHWRQGKREGMKGKYSRAVASQGNKNADPFVAYLGFLRDSSLRGNVNVIEKEMAQIYG